MDAPEKAPGPPGPPPRWPSDWASLAAGGSGLAWGAAGFVPGWTLSAWPAASLGVLGLALAVWPGRALPRGVGAFLGLWALLLGLLRIGLLWGLVRALGAG